MKKMKKKTKNFCQKISLISLFLLSFLCCSCYRVEDKIQPEISYSIHEKYLHGLPSAFSSLSEEEKQQRWGQEYLIGVQLAKEIDLYRAVTAFKRAEILLPKEHETRLLEIQYEKILCYYFGKRYNNVIDTFENSQLLNVDKSFPPFRDLLIILHDSYKQTDEQDKMIKIQELIEKDYPVTAKELNLSTALSSGHFPQTKQVISNSSEKKIIYDSLLQYERQKKSVGSAQLLNAALPGAGYLYIGQKKSALTSFFINSLFIAAAYQFFHKGYTAAGIITTSFEMGWYFGGIYGAGQEAKYFNEKIYEKQIGQTMNHTKLFPIYMLEFTF